MLVAQILVAEIGGVEGSGVGRVTVLRANEDNCARDGDGLFFLLGWRGFVGFVALLPSD